MTVCSVSGRRTVMAGSSLSTGSITNIAGASPIEPAGALHLFISHRPSAVNSTNRVIESDSLRMVKSQPARWVTRLNSRVHAKAATCKAGERRKEAITRANAPQLRIEKVNWNAEAR